MQLAAVAALTPNNWPLVLHIKPQSLVLPQHTNHCEYSPYQEYLTSLLVLVLRY